MINNNSMPYLFFALFLLALAPWAYFHLQTSVQADVIWLSYAAEQFLAGKSISDTYFDTNPPMCFLVYIPVILLKSMGLPLWYAHLAYMAMLSLLSITASAYFIAHWKVALSSKLMILGGFIFGSTVLMSHEYGQKDHLIALALFPFVLAQFSLMNNPETRRSTPHIIAILVMIIALPFILIKPHYGILPCAAIAYRLYQSRNWKSIFRADFIILAAGVLGYIGLLYVAFPDFISLILPLSLNVYVGQIGATHNPMVSVALIGFSLLLLVFTAFADRASQPEKELGYVVAAMTALCVIPFWVQAKGFSLHLLPTMVIGCTGVIYIFWLHMKEAPVKNRITTVFALITAVALVGYILKPSETRTHSYFKNHPLLAELGITEGTEAFFIENNSTNVALPLATYNEMRHASRFSANWIASTPLWTMDDQERRLEIIDLLGNGIAEDMERYKPDIMLFIDTEKLPRYLVLLQNHEHFSNALAQYERVSTFETMDIYNYGAKDVEDLIGPVPYAVYKRKAP